MLACFDRFLEKELVGRFIVMFMLSRNVSKVCIGGVSATCRTDLLKVSWIDMGLVLLTPEEMVDRTCWEGFHSK